MQTDTRYLYLSGTHLGPAAECSCIFCINAVAAADRHLPRECGGSGSVVSGRAQPHVDLFELRAVRNAVKYSVPGAEIICFVKQGYTTPLFSVNKDDGARWPLLHGYNDNGICCRLPPRIPSCTVVLSCRMVWSHVFSNVFRDRVYVKFSSCLDFQYKALLLSFRGGLYSGSFSYVSNS